MTLALEWSEQAQFRSQPLRAWTVDGDIAGVTRSGGGLTFATIVGAGHMVRLPRVVRMVADCERWTFIFGCTTRTADGIRDCHRRRHTIGLLSRWSWRTGGLRASFCEGGLKLSCRHRLNLNM